MKCPLLLRSWWRIALAGCTVHQTEAPGFPVRPTRTSMSVTALPASISQDGIPSRRFRSPPLGSNGSTPSSGCRCEWTCSRTNPGNFVAQTSER